LAGSYEEGPPSLTDMLVRDRRWCQGNLQHALVVPARGLHWVSRSHLLVGIGHYLTAPMWAMLMLVGLAIPLQASGPFAPAGAAYAPLAYWREADPSRFLWLFALTMVLLFAPKLLGLLATLLDRRLRRACGGGWRLAAGAVLETVLAALMAPVTMYLQSRGVAEVLAGRDSGWNPQRRDDGSLPMSELLSRYGGMTLFGLGAAMAAYLVSPGLAAWMSPVIAGLVLSIPVVALTSSPGAGAWLRRRGIFATPEETAPPAILRRAAEVRRGGGGGRAWPARPGIDPPAPPARLLPGPPAGVGEALAPNHPQTPGPATCSLPRLRGRAGWGSRQPRCRHPPQAAKKKRETAGFPLNPASAGGLVLWPGQTSPRRNLMQYLKLSTLTY